MHSNPKRPSRGWNWYPNDARNAFPIDEMSIGSSRNHYKNESSIYKVAIRSILLYGQWEKRILRYLHWSLILDIRNIRYVYMFADKISHDSIHLCSNTTCINNAITNRCLRSFFIGIDIYILLLAKSCDAWRQKKGGPRLGPI